MRNQPGRSLTNEEILAEIRIIANKLKKTVLSGTDIKNHSDINKGLLASRFGSISTAITLAGLSPAISRHSDDEIFENLFKVWTFYGRPPTHLEIDEPPSVIASSTYIRRFGGWRNALREFVERFGSDDAAPPKVAAPQTTETNPPVAASGADNRPPHLFTPRAHVTPRPPANKRDPSIGLRFRVLQRDHFRCRLCGPQPCN